MKALKFPSIFRSTIITFKSTQTRRFRFIKPFSPHHRCTNECHNIRKMRSHTRFTPFRFMSAYETVWVNTCTQGWQAVSGNEGFGVLSRYIMQQMAFRPSLARPLPRERERERVEKKRWMSRRKTGEGQGCCLFLFVCLTCRNTCFLLFACLLGCL